MYTNKCLELIYVIVKLLKLLLKLTCWKHTWQFRVNGQSNRTDQYYTCIIRFIVPVIVVRGLIPKIIVSSQGRRGIHFGGPDTRSPTLTPQLRVCLSCQQRSCARLFVYNKNNIIFDWSTRSLVYYDYTTLDSRHINYINQLLLLLL